MKYRHIINHFRQTPLAILESKAFEIQEFLLEKANGVQLSDEEVRQRIGAKAKPRAGKSGSVAVMDIFGVIHQRINEMDVSSGGGFSVEKFKPKFRAMVADPDVKAIVLNVDSPGGSVFGVDELAQEIYEARTQKHIVAVSNSLMASAAYYIGSQADEVVVTPGGIVGSIGVFTVHENWSERYAQEGIKPTVIKAGKYKTEANGFEPLSDEARDAIQKDIDFYYDQFVNAVARGRGVSAKDVKNGFAEGRAVTAKEAKKVGLVDRIATFDEVLAGLGVSIAADQKPMAQQSDRRISVSVAQKKLELSQL